MNECIAMVLFTLGQKEALLMGKVCLQWVGCSHTCNRILFHRICDLLIMCWILLYMSCCQEPSLKYWSRHFHTRVLVLPLIGMRMLSYIGHSVSAPSLYDPSHGCGWVPISCSKGSLSHWCGHYPTWVLAHLLIGLRCAAYRNQSTLLQRSRLFLMEAMLLPHRGHVAPSQRPWYSLTEAIVLWCPLTEDLAPIW